MAFEFTGGDSDVVRFAADNIGGDMNDGTTMAMHARVWQDDAAGVNEAILSINNSGNSSANIILYATATDRLAFFVRHASIQQRVSSVGAVPKGQWVDIAVNWQGGQASTQIQIYIDNVEPSYGTPNEGSGARSAADGGIDIGNFAGANSWDGRIAEPAVWRGMNLDVGQRGSLAAGFSPKLISPDKQIFQPRLTRNTGDDVSGVIGAITGATVVSHPRVIYPSVPIIGIPTAAAAAAIAITAARIILGQPVTFATSILVERGTFLSGRPVIFTHIINIGKGILNLVGKSILLREGVQIGKGILNFGRPVTFTVGAISKIYRLSIGRGVSFIRGVGSKKVGKEDVSKITNPEDQ